jgi:geranylgeranyl transferase type-1 subunit beta
MTSSSCFLADRHIKYFASALDSLPEPYVKLDSNRLTLVHFAVQALDLLQVWDSSLWKDYDLDPLRIIQWIYRLYLPRAGGFQGGSYAGTMPISNDVAAITPGDDYSYCQAHIAMTYTALCTLVTLGDDLRSLDTKRIIQQLESLQRADGSFQCTTLPSENDMRFLYCACAISHMLGDWSGINIDLAVDYIRRCRSYEGALSLIPGMVRNSNWKDDVFNSLTHHLPRTRSYRKAMEAPHSVELRL